MKRLALLLWCALALEGDWRESRSVTLEKDEFERIDIKSDYSTRELAFRWTLYTDDTLVVLSRFDDRVTQHMLRRNHTNQSYRLELAAPSARKVKVPYVLVRFTEFDAAANKASFEIHLFDDDREVLLEYKRRDKQ